MTDEQRQILLAKMAKATREAKKMSPDEAKRRLFEEGIYDEHGHLSPRYGGRPATAG